MRKRKARGKLGAGEDAMQRRQLLARAKRVVVKVGTALLTTDQHLLNTRFIGKLAREVAALRREGREIILVTSGAIGAGLQLLGRRERPRTIPAKQALAALGQPRLMRAYAQAFQRHGLLTAQVLLTADDIHHRQRYAHARNALLELLRLGVIPVFNENDTVAVDEIKFGDNDTLSAHITNLSEADVLIILTDVAGLYTRDPRQDPDARLLSQVERIDRQLENTAGGAGTRLGTGGMQTKLLAAKMVTGMGEEQVIADGRLPRVLPRILAGENVGTIFYPQGDKLAARKCWIAFALKRRGLLVLDAGAQRAVRDQGRSLLPSGVTAVEGTFKQGDSVGLAGPDGHEFARGLVAYSSDDLAKIKGQKTSAIEERLGYKNRDEVIHRNDLVLIDRDA